MNFFLKTPIPFMSLIGAGQFTFDSWMVWLFLVIVLIIIEANTAMLLTIWFVAAGVLAFVSALLNFSIPIQIAVFVVFSAIFLWIGLKMRKRLNVGRHQRTATNADRLIGQIAIVSIPIDAKYGQGQVKISGMYWSAQSEVETVIPIGEEVRVLSIRGNKLIVEAVNGDS